MYSIQHVHAAHNVQIQSTHHIRTVVHVIIVLHIISKECRGMQVYVIRLYFKRVQIDTRIYKHNMCTQYVTCVWHIGYAPNSEKQGGMLFY